MMCRPESSPLALYCAAQSRRSIAATHLLLSIGEELADVLLALADKLVQDLRAVDDLGLARVEHLADLPRHERLAGAGRSVEEQT